MTRPMVVFSHGQESGPWGTKIKVMAERVRQLGCRADSVDYQGIADPTSETNGVFSPKEQALLRVTGFCQAQMTGKAPGTCRASLPRNGWRER